MTGNVTREGYIAPKRPAYRCMRGVSACPKIQTFCRKRPVFFDSHTPVGRAKAGTRFDSAICSPKRTTTQRVVVLFGGGEGSRTLAVYQPENKCDLLTEVIEIESVEISLFLAIFPVFSAKNQKQFASISGRIQVSISFFRHFFDPVIS